MLCCIHPCLNNAYVAYIYIYVATRAQQYCSILTCCLLLAAKQLHSASRGQKQQPPQHQPWHSCLSAHTRSQSPVIEEVKWSDLPVHAVCAVLAVGGHQLLRIVRKRRQRGAAGGDDSSRRHTHERQGQPVRNRLQGRSRLSGNHPRFL